MSAPHALAAPTPASYVMVGSLVLIWGTTFLLVKFALVEASPFMVAATRIIIAALAVGAYAVLSRRKLPENPAVWVSACAIGVFTVALPISLLTWAQQIVPSGVAGIYMAGIPLLVLPLAHFFSPGETMTRRKLAGFCIGFCGVLMLMGATSLSALGSSNGQAQIACLCAATSYACGSIITRRTPPTDPITLSALALGVGGLLILPFGIGAWPDAPLSSYTWAILLTLGVVSSGLSMILRVKVISSVGSVFMSTAGYLVPITAMTVGVLIGGEVLEAWDVAGCALILSGLAIAQRKNPAKSLK